MASEADAVTGAVVVVARGAARRGALDVIDDVVDDQRAALARHTHAVHRQLEQH